MFKFIDIQITNFRGFGSSHEPIMLNGNLVIFYGPNGFGKTSLSEAF
ncbi:MAG: AAA family ATPase, partial [Gammaproteobacteria bacterium]